MKKLLLFLTLSLSISAATPEQVEQYLSLSHAEEDVLALESQYTSVQNSFTQNKNLYDMQLLMIRFKEKLQTELSDNEMDDILQTYNNIVYLQFISNQVSEKDLNATEKMIESLKNDPEFETRMQLVDEINHALNQKEIIGIMYDDLMTPFLKNAKGGKDLSDTMLKKRKNTYIQSTITASKFQIINATKEFSMDELQELLDIVKSPAVQHEKKAIYKATAYAFKEFFLSIANRYDVKKHQPSRTLNTQSNT